MERFVQNPHGGSIVSIGSAREAFPATSNNYQQSFFDGIAVRATSSTSATAISASRLPFMASIDRNTVDRWTQFNYNLLGDPALAVWTGLPRAVAVNAPASIAAGAQNLTVTVTAGGPVAGALVCARKGNETYAYGETDAAGSGRPAGQPDLGRQSHGHGHRLEPGAHPAPGAGDHRGRLPRLRADRRQRPHRPGCGDRQQQRRGGSRRDASN